MIFSTISRAREISGLDNSTNVADATVSGKLSIASGMVAAAVGQRYTLPIPFHFASTLTFSGTASGAGTMAVVVNGTTYNISIESGDTASQVADKFRRAVTDSDDFVTDDEGLGASVLVISQTDSETDEDTAYDEVDITSVPTTVSVSGTYTTRVRRYPRIIEQLTADIAAALLLLDDYGIEAEDTSKDGGKKMTVADKQLKRIQGTDTDGIITKIYDEVTHAEIPTSDTESPSFLPNDTTSDPDYEDEDGNSATTAPQSTMNQIF